MVAITFSLFLVFYLFSSYIHTNLAINENQKISEALSKQVFNSMYQVMRQGWSREQLQEFINVTKDSFEGSSYSVDIFRGKKVEELFGKIDQSNITADIKHVFRTKEKLYEENKKGMQSVMPIIASNECLKCHTNSKEGDILGAVKVSYSFEDIVEETKIQYLLFSLIILPVMLLITYYISLRMLGRVNLSIENFKDKIDSVNSVKEFKNIDTSHVKDSFKEFERIMEGLNSLSQKLKNVAVDKSILEFEVKLLDKMVITSDIIKDWKEYIKDLMHEIHIVLPIYCLITIFKTDDENYEIEIFWLGEPDEHIKKHIEQTSIKMIKEHHKLDAIDYVLRHNVSNELYCLGEITIDDIEHEAKSILLDAPRIGGIVGLGIQSTTEKDSIHSIVIDSILTTLLNLVGSIKAINKYTENLEFYATRDPLTKLFSQRVFRDLLEYEVKRAARHEYKFGVLVIDCDNFKPLNDTYGHSFGDEFLKEFANLLQESKRDEDILSRYGGDEFTIILPESDEKEVYTVAVRILDNIEKFEIEAPDGIKVGVTASIGMSIFPDHSKDPKELFNIADNMMYQAKNLGKNGIKFPSEYDIDRIHQEIEDKSMIVLDAIKNEKIIPHFQPIMNTANDKIEINELLMRIEINNDILTAGKFIETAESLGIVHKMDYIVIEKAFKKIKETDYKGILFINLSPKALIIGEFINKIVNLATLYEIENEKIVFEITERETVKSFSLLEKFVQNLKMEGFRFAIDDFGSGFSTFHYVKRFPIDYIKIDGEFIINLTKDEKDLAFVKSIVALAKELKVNTVAEFVEDEDILKFLKEIEVDYAQGFYIGRPNPELIVKN